MRIPYTMQVKCSPEHLWQFLERPELQKQWLKGVEENVPTSEGPPGPGSTFRMKIREGRKVAEYDGEVLARDEPRQLTIRLRGGAFGPNLAVHVDYRLTPVEGGTRLDYLCTMEGKLGFFMRLLLPLGKLFMRWQLRSFMKTLKRLAESPAPAAAA